MKLKVCEDINLQHDCWTITDLAHPELFPNLSKAWSPIFNGRAVAALAANPAVFAKTGRAFDIGVLADAYGFTDLDGRRPAPLR